MRNAINLGGEFIAAAQASDPDQATAEMNPRHHVGKAVIRDVVDRLQCGAAIRAARAVVIPIARR